MTLGRTSEVTPTGARVLSRASLDFALGSASMSYLVGFPLLFVTDPMSHASV